MEKAIWWSAIALIVNVACWTVIVDLFMISQGQDSITDYLRSSPLAFWIPAICGFLAVITLALHLFAHPHLPGAK